MKLVLEPTAAVDEASELEVVLLSLKLLGLLLTWQRLADGLYMVEADDEILKDLSQLKWLTRCASVSVLQ